MEGINYVEKLHKNTIKWIGGKEDPEMEREILETRRKVEDLTSEEKRLDYEIATLNGQIKEDFLDNEELKQYHYITFEDCLNICESMCKTDPSKGMLVVAAPKGTSLEVGEEDHGECVLKMDATGQGAIKIFSCKLSEGVKQVDMAHQPK